MLLIFKSLLFGTLSYAVRRLGTSLILFAYLYVAHSKQFSRLEASQGTLTPELWLAGAVILLGTVLIAFRSAFSHYCQMLDAKALPIIDQLMLTRLNRCDLSIMNLRGKSKSALESSKALLLMILLIVLCGVVAKPLAFILLAVLTLTYLLSWWIGHIPPEKITATTFSKLRYQPDNYIEILLVIGLIMGFLLVTPKSGVISGTVLILMIARFSGALRTIAVSNVGLLRSHAKDKATWNRRKKAKEAAAARAEAKAALKAEKTKAAKERQNQVNSSAQTVA